MAVLVTLKFFGMKEKTCYWPGNHRRPLLGAQTCSAILSMNLTEEDSEVEMFARVCIIFYFVCISTDYEDLEKILPLVVNNIHTAEVPNNSHLH